GPKHDRQWAKNRRADQCDERYEYQERAENDGQPGHHAHIKIQQTWRCCRQFDAQVVREGAKLAEAVVPRRLRTRCAAWHAARRLITVRMNVLTAGRLIHSRSPWCRTLYRDQRHRAVSKFTPLTSQCGRFGLADR